MTTTTLEELRSRPLQSALGTLFTTQPYPILAAMIALSLFLAYTLAFVGSTTLAVFFISNTWLYVTLSIFLTVLLSVFGGVALTQTMYILNVMQPLRRGQGAARGLGGVTMGLLSAGCPSCASLILPLLGIAGSLAAFPLGGLEIKGLALLLMVDALWEGSRLMAGVCPPLEGKLISMDDETLSLTLSWAGLRQLKPVALLGAFVLALYLLPGLPAEAKVNFDSGRTPAVANVRGTSAWQQADAETLAAQINPAEGYTLPAIYSDIGPQLVDAGAIDLEKFIEVFEQSGEPLTDEQLQILTTGSDSPITITRENSHFLLNLSWALGLANQNPILDEGPLMQYGEGQVTRFASTGGWTLATKPIPEVYSSTPIITLTAQQQRWVEEAAENTYRPCCGNSTAFADCNHGMAMLGLFELMASQGATLDELFEAAKYINAFWFPQQTLDVATYFQATQGISFAEIDARTLVGPEYSSGRGWSAVKQWLQQNGEGQQLEGGGGCGV